MPKLHSTWSASSSARNLYCAGNIALSENLPRAPGGYAANWGTACHELCEMAMNAGVEVSTFLGTSITVEDQEFEVDDGMVDCAEEYIGYIESQKKAGYTVLGIEVKFSLDSLQLGMEAGGTADCVLYHPKLKVLEVVDLKTGKGHIVEVTDNAQARFYAVGAVLEFPKLGVRKFRSTIVQPRAPHKDGAVRSEELDPLDMLDWSSELTDGISKAAKAVVDYANAGANAVKLDDWMEEYLKPSKSFCTFCPAAGGCPAQRRMATDTAGLWYDDGGEPQFKSNALADNAPDVVERDLNMIELMEEWIKGRRALAHALAMGGHKFAEWEMVEKIGNRKFVSPDATPVEDVIFSRVGALVTKDDLYVKKLKSPAGIEGIKAIGKKGVADWLSDLIVNPVTGTDLVRIGKRSRNRRPVKDTAEQFYEQ